MKRWRYRSLCLVLVLVMLVSAVLQPRAEALVLVDDLAIIIIATLLVSCGVVVASDQQAMSMAKHALDTMSGEVKEGWEKLLEECTEIINGVMPPDPPPEPPPPVEVNPIIEAAVSVTFLDMFRQFVRDTFQIDDEKIANGELYLPDVGIVGNLITVKNEAGEVTGYENFSADLSTQFPNKFYYPSDVGKNLSFYFDESLYTACVQIKGGLSVLSIIRPDKTSVNMYGGNEIIGYNCSFAVVDGVLYYANALVPYLGKYTKLATISDSSNDTVVLTPPAFEYEYDLSDYIGITIPETIEDLVGKEWTDVVKVENPATNPDPEPNPDPDPDPDPDPNPNPDPEGIDWSPLKSLKGFVSVFPFCIPFDIIDMVKSLNTNTTEAPVFTIPLKMPKAIAEKGVSEQEIVIDFSLFDSVIPIVRVLILLMFAVSLAWSTSKVIKW